MIEEFEKTYVEHLMFESQGNDLVPQLECEATVRAGKAFSAKTKK